MASASEPDVAKLNYLGPKSAGKSLDQLDIDAYTLGDDIPAEAGEERTATVLTWDHSFVLDYDGQTVRITTNENDKFLDTFEDMVDGRSFQEARDDHYTERTYRSDVKADRLEPYTGADGTLDERTQDVFSTVLESALRPFLEPNTDIDAAGADDPTALAYDVLG